MTIYDAQAVNAILFTQTLTTHAKYLAASNFLSFNQTLICNIKPTQASNRLFFKHTLTRIVFYNLDVHQYLSFNQRAIPRTYFANVNQLLFFTHKLYRIFDAKNKLIFNQTVSIEKLKGVNQGLALQQNASCNLVRNRSINQTLNFRSYATAYKVSRCFIGSPIVNPPTGHFHDVTFVSGNYTLTLRAPDFDNSDKLQFTRVNRQTRGGDLTIFRDPIWPQSAILALKWSTLAQKDINNILIFLKATIGQLVEYTDYEGRVFTGVIKTPASEVVESARQLNSAELEFEVE